MPSGRSCSIAGSSARTASETSSGLAVACLTTPSATALRPLKRTLTRSFSGPNSAWPTSPSRIG